MSVFDEVDPQEWLAHNDLAFAIRDGFPVSPGHALVIPRRIVASWWEVTPDERAALFDLVDIVKRRIDAEFAPAGYNVGFNGGVAAGQTVDHLHIHVIPRYDGDVDDPRGGIRHVIPGKGNYLTVSPGDSAARNASTPLVTPFDGQLKLELLRCLIRDNLDRIDLLVSFIMRSGIDLVARHLDDALARGARIRVLTTDYLGITDTASLGFFLDRVGPHGPGRLDVRVFSDPATSFHPKAYVFSSSANDSGLAFVGSSNLSRSGITQGVEWNIRTRDVKQLRVEFDRLWNDPRSVTLTREWLANYAQRRPQREIVLPVVDPASDSTVAVDADLAAFGEVGFDDADATPKPWSVQAEALAALEATRVDGHGAGLVVMATGLGKTWLAAFDSTRPEFRRVLFVAHREEILRQARDVYRQLRPSEPMGLLVGDERNTQGAVVFASIQSLQGHLDEFAPDSFDYIVIDEFHHAAAPTYRKVLGHFRPRFLLGLTATPDRADAADLLALCSDNLVYDCGLVEGVNRELLCPFVYRAIPDVADYAEIPWRSGRFDAEELTTELATRERARQVFDEWTRLGGSRRRTIGFCSTIRHAEFMAEQFREFGVDAVAVHSGSTSAPRAESLERLAAGKLAAIFTVDLFNEGVDVPALDLVLLLRPTESPVVFIQQLGRGLRRAENKNHLDVVDLVGNHRGFLLKARLLAALAGRLHVTDREAVNFLTEHRDALADGTAGLPEGCSIIVAPEVVDLLRQLAGPASSQDRLGDLARQWVDDHDGRRPTALELSIAFGQAFTLKSAGGWFGFLNRLGLLTDNEQRVLGKAAEFLLWIEHGSYTKSYKLVTLGVLARAGRVRSGMAVAELASACRWAVLRDPELHADLNDATGSFADVGDPTPSEWLPYWNKNPIRALTAASRGAKPWFSVHEGVLTGDVDVPDGLDDVFNDLVAEITEYRLHRYLAGQKSRRIGEQRQFARDGKEIDATFTVESTRGRPTSVVIESSGGTKGSPSARNLDYVSGFDLLLERLCALDIPVLDIAIDTSRTQDLSAAERRLDPDGHGFPLNLGNAADLVALRKSLLRSMGRVGRSVESKGGGNARKRTRFVVAVPAGWTSSSLANALASGDVANRPTLSSASTSQPQRGITDSR